MSSHVLMEGELGVHSVYDLLNVMSLSRQSLEMELDGPAGRCCLRTRSGKLTAANTQSGQTGLLAAMHVADTTQGRFRLRRVSTALSTALLDLAQLQRLQRWSTLARSGPVLLEADTNPSTREVLETLSLSRQQTALRAFGADRVLGELHVKSGQLLGGWSPSGTGAASVAGVLNATVDRVVVHHTAGIIHHESIGVITALLDGVAPPEMLLMEGKTDGSIEGLLDMASLCRQTLALRWFDHEDTLCAELLVRSGWVCAARVGPHERVRGRTRIPGAVRFEVLRVAEAPPPWMSLQQWATPQVPASRVLMEGELAEVDLPELLGLLSLCRQTQRLDLVGATTTQVWVKGGQLLDIRRNGRNAAVEDLRTVDATHYRTSVVAAVPRRLAWTLAQVLAVLTPPEMGEEALPTQLFEAAEIEAAEALLSEPVEVMPEESLLRRLRDLEVRIEQLETRSTSATRDPLWWGVWTFQVVGWSALVLLFLDRIAGP